MEQVHGEDTVWQQRWRQRIAAMKFADALVGIPDRIGIDQHPVVPQIGDPVFRDGRDRIQLQLHRGVQFERRVCDFNDEKDVRGVRVLFQVSPSPRSQKNDIRHRSRELVEHDTTLNADDRFPLSQPDERFVHAIDDESVARSWRRHDQDLSVNELRPLVRSQDADLRHLVAIVDGEQLSNDLG